MALCGSRASTNTVSSVLHQRTPLLSTRAFHQSSCSRSCLINSSIPSAHRLSSSSTPLYSITPPFKALSPTSGLHQSIRTFACSATQQIMAPTTKSNGAKDHTDTSDHPGTHQTGTGTEGKHEWKQRPPYKVHDNGENFKVIHEASCHCEKVKYSLSRDEPLDSKLCHCGTCQKQHAAPFQWAAIFHKDDINFTHGHHDLEWCV